MLSNPKLLISIMLCCVTAMLHAQSKTLPKWMKMNLTDKVFYPAAAIKINNRDATYEEMKKIPDSSILKVEIYPKKQARKIIEKDNANDGLIMITLRTGTMFNYSAEKKELPYIVSESGDTTFCNNYQVAMIYGDTTNGNWSHFLERQLKAQVPADNGAPIGIYNVDIEFMIDENGSVYWVDVLEDPGYKTGAEVKRLMNHSPDWEPSVCNGGRVKTRQRQRITFAVTG